MTTIITNGLQLTNLKEFNNKNNNNIQMFRKIANLPLGILNCDIINESNQSNSLISENMSDIENNSESESDNDIANHADNESSSLNDSNDSNKSSLDNQDDTDNNNYILI